MKPWERYAQQDGPWTKYATAPAAQTQPTDPTEDMSQFELAAAGMGKAFVDLARGFKQRLDEAAAGLEGIVPGGEELSRMTGTKTAAEIRDEGQAAIAEAKRLDAPLMKRPMAIAGNIAGGMVGAAPLAAMGPVGMGAVMGAATPTTDGSTEILKNIAMGAGGAWAGDKLVRGVARTIQPKVRPEVKALMAEGVTPTPGQIIGGNAARAEAKATSLPLVGDAIANSQRRAGEELNRAVANRALEPIGRKLPKGLQGRDAVRYVDDALGDAYDALLPRMTTQADAVWSAEIGNLRQMVNTGAIDPQAAKAFNRILQNDVLGKFKGQQAITGQTLKQIEGDLGARVRQLSNSNDADQRLVGDALQEVQAALRRLLERSNPQHADELRAINTGWANFKRLQKAAGYLGAEDGIFTPSQLQSAVRAMDKSKDKARFAEGNALMQDLSDAAKSVMGPKYPDSGTAGRLMNVGALVSGIHQPAIPALLGGGALLYTSPAQKAAAALLTKRPPWAPLLANEIEAVAPLGGLLGYGMSQ